MQEDFKIKARRMKNCDYKSYVNNVSIEAKTFKPIME